jgi:dihydrolipoamide dehydrogenase
MSNIYDLLIIGGGPAGYIAALRSAQLGASVALIEKDRVGGTCINRGCIPTKAIITCTNLYDKFKKAEAFGIQHQDLSIDLKKVVERKNKIVGMVVKGIEFLLEKNGVDSIAGTAKVLEPGKIEVTNSDGSKTTVEGHKLILATGSAPTCLPGLSFDKETLLRSDDLLSPISIPDKLTIVGGGVIGIHFAQIYSSLGSEVTIYEALPEILPGIDEEIVGAVKTVLNRKNIKIHTGARFDPTKASGKTLICIGRTPNIAGIESLPLKMEKGRVLVNEKMETSLPGIYAAGDLVSKKMFAHVAYEQGLVAAENALGGNKLYDYGCVPYGIYTNPEIGAVGLTEKEARENNPEVKIGKFPYAALGIATAMGEREGFIKVIADENRQLLGVHILGVEATTLIGSATLALKNKLTVDQLAETFQAHPTYPEGLQEAALNVLGRSLHIIN